jgi:hypothetical protein
MQSRLQDHGQGARSVFVTRGDTRPGRPADHHDPRARRLVRARVIARHAATMSARGTLRPASLCGTPLPHRRASSRVILVLVTHRDRVVAWVAALASPRGSDHRGRPIPLPPHVGRADDDWQSRATRRKFDYASRHDAARGFAHRALPPSAHCKQRYARVAPGARVWRRGSRRSPCASCIRGPRAEVCTNEQLRSAHHPWPADTDLGKLLSDSRTGVAWAASSPSCPRRSECRAALHAPPSRQIRRSRCRA